MLRPSRFGLALGMVIAVLLPAQGLVRAEEPSYRLVDGWAQLPEGVEAWGQAIGVDLDAAGHLWVFHRCFANNCIGRDNQRIQVFDQEGRLLDQ